jgi:hypothetical protein
MSGAFQNIDPPPPSPPGECVPLVRGRTHSLVGQGVGVLEDARNCSVLYIRKYFVPVPVTCLILLRERGGGERRLGEKEKKEKKTGGRGKIT